MEKTCETCIFEYSCDWTPAGRQACCKNWKEDLLGLENRDDKTEGYRKSRLKNRKKSWTVLGGKEGL